MNDPNNLVACPLPILDEVNSKDVSSYNNIKLRNKGKNLKHQDVAATNKLGVGVFKGLKADDDEDDDASASKKAIEEEKLKKDESEKRNACRRYMASCDMDCIFMDCIFISSYGDEFDPSIEVIYKEQQDSSSNRMMLARKEMQDVFDACSKDRSLFLKDVCPDFPGVQFSKEDHLERIKQIMLSSEKGVVIWYTGHGEKDTGNWCFKDGVISFQDVFDLYKQTHEKKKHLTIVCDCSYSGNWIKQCAEKLDEMDIPACGHHAIKKGIFLRIFPTCKANEKATINTYAKEGIFIVDGSVRFRRETLTSGQTSLRGDFSELRCSSKSSPCDISSKWCDRLIGKNLFFKVTGTDQGQPAWHLVLVDEDKFEEYNALFRDGARPRVDVSKYGKILESGWGEQPPEDVIDKFSAYYMEY